MTHVPFSLRVHRITEPKPLCPFVSSALRFRWLFPAFFNVLSNPSAWASRLQLHMKAGLGALAATCSRCLLISRLKVRFLPRSPSFQPLRETAVHKISCCGCFCGCATDP